jgi:hypothetical protein
VRLSVVGAVHVTGIDVLVVKVEVTAGAGAVGAVSCVVPDEAELKGPDPNGFNAATVKV